jgi:hypothetical protein
MFITCLIYNKFKVILNKYSNQFEQLESNIELENEMVTFTTIIDQCYSRL